MTNIYAMSYKTSAPAEIFGQHEMKIGGTTKLRKTKKQKIKTKKMQKL